MLGGLYWDHIGVMLGLHWDYIRVVLGQCEIKWKLPYKDYSISSDALSGRGAQIRRAVVSMRNEPFGI